MADNNKINRRSSAGSSLGHWLQRYLSRILGVITAVLLFLMMMLTLLDVVGRYVFDSPVMGAYEITEIVLAVLIFAGIPLATANDEHIAVDLIDSIIPRSIAKIRDILITLIMALVMGALCKSIFLKGVEAIEYSDQSAMLHIPMSPVYFVLSVTLAIACLVSLALAWQYFTCHFYPSERKLNL